VLEAYGIAPTNLGVHKHVDYPEVGQVLMNGGIDAFTWDSPLPAPAISELAAASETRIRFVPTGDAVPKMTAKHGPFYFSASIPRGIYGGADEDVSAAVGGLVAWGHFRP
jgi:uncharacterized protein